MTEHQHISQLHDWLNSQIIGQQQLTQRLLIALLADGHLLVEGAPGLAKTKAIKTLSEAIEGSFQRIQFTPDLLPGDVTGSEIYRPETGVFEFQRGPIFHNLLLADEINRAPAKVQSALLEAMAERQVSVGSHSYALDSLFLVMATQNPLEQEGTYPLPEAQLDRFLMYVRVGYPAPGVERDVLRLVRDEAGGVPPPHFRPVAQTDVFRARSQVLEVHLAPALEEYMVQLVVATRDPAPYDAELGRWVEWGASPRATIALDRCSRARAWLEGRSYVTPEDVHAVVFEILRHRVLLTYEARAEGITPDGFIRSLIDTVPLP